MREGLRLEMKRLLFVMYSLNNGGAERSLVNLLCELDPKRYQIDLLLFAHEGMFLPQVPDYVNVISGGNILEILYSQKAKHSIRNYPVILFKVVSTAITRLFEKGVQAQNAARWIKFYSRIVPELNKQYDVAVAYISRDIMYYVDEKVNAKKKIVFIHNDYRAAGHPKKFDTAYFERMNALVTISDTCAKVLCDEFPSMAGKIDNLPNIVSSKVIRKRAASSMPTEFEKCDGIKIVSIGRLNEQKGFDWAIQAAQILKEKGIKFQWLIIGNGELQSSLNRLIDSTGTGDSIHLIGPRENPYIYIRAADIVVQSSRWEGKSVVLDEAKIIGTPIVTTNYPTAQDQIIEEKEGLIVDMNPVAIVKGIERLSNDDKLREEIHGYLMNHEYGNVEEMNKYYALFDGDEHNKR